MKNQYPRNNKCFVDPMYRDHGYFNQRKKKSISQRFFFIFITPYYRHKQFHNVKKDFVCFIIISNVKSIFNLIDLFLHLRRKP